MNAMQYLNACDLAAISVIMASGACEVRVGIDPAATTVWWVPKARAIAVTRKARAIAGDAPSAAEMNAALHEAAAKQKVVLTANEAALTRAARAAQRLDLEIARMRKTGQLRAFTAEYKKRRQAAVDAGNKFMTYPVAEARLKKALIPRLTGSAEPSLAMPSFNEIFA